MALAVVAAFAWSGVARAQEAGTAGAGGGEVELRIEQFGVGGVVRRGDWAGLRVAYSDTGSQPRNIVLRVETRDADGDRPQHERAVATTPGQRQAAWVYLKTPARIEQGDTLLVTAHEAEEVTGPDGSATFAAGRKLGTLYAPVQQVQNERLGLIGVVGSGEIGLTGYGVRRTGSLHLPNGHEASDIVAGLRPGALPDRWIGLAPFSVMVWTSRDLPELGKERAEALKEWVCRGGHLVVVLTSASADLWPSDEVNNPLFSIMPEVRKTTNPSAPLEELRSLLTRDERPMGTAMVTTFEVLPGARDVAPIVVDSGGRALVVRRIVGAGAVTLVGIDLENRQLSMQGRPDPNVFWHRVLGRRGQLLTQQQMNDPEARFTATGATEGVLDRFIPELIEQKGRSAVGVLLGFVLFAVYWIVAAPGSYAGLRAAKLTRHSWVAFIASVGVFTLVAWGGATLLRPARMTGTYVAVVEHIYGTPAELPPQRARMWVNLMAPWYGSATVRLRDPKDDSPEWHNAVSPWESPALGRVSTFPDARGYQVDGRDPGSITFPTRSTVKELQIEWAGTPRWSMPAPVAIEGQTEAGEIKLLPRPESITELRSTLAGGVKHNLPAPMTNVVVFVVRGQRPLSASAASLLVADAEAWPVSGDWAPGDVLNLGELTARTPQNRTISRDADEYLKALASQSLGGSDIMRADARRKAMVATSLINVLPPHRDETDVIATRRGTHGYDLGRWFTQPCVIIVGVVGDGERETGSPAPIFAGPSGSRELREVPMRGQTMVRWVYPLPANPVATTSLARSPIGPEGAPAADGGTGG